MKKALLILTTAALALGGCSQADNDSADMTAPYEAAETTTEAATMTANAEASGATSDRESAEIGSGQGAIPIALPKLAYSYGYNYSLPGDDLSGLMRRHANLCEQQGPASCYIIGMDMSGNVEDDDRRGTLQLAVATQHARAVGALLENEAEDAGAEQLSATIATDELSKQMVDTEARIATRIALRDRLLDVLKTRRGKVEELVAAERGVAEVNQEIDQAKSWLAEMRGSVQFSKLDLEYRSAEAAGSTFLDPVKGALGSLGSIFGMMLAALIVMLAVALPIGGVIVAIRKLLARGGTNKPVAADG